MPYMEDDISFGTTEPQGESAIPIELGAQMVSQLPENILKRFADSITKPVDQAPLWMQILMPKIAQRIDQMGIVRKADAIRSMENYLKLRTKEGTIGDITKEQEVTTPAPPYQEGQGMPLWRKGAQIPTGEKRLVPDISKAMKRPLSEASNIKTIWGLTGGEKQKIGTHEIGGKLYGYPTEIKKGEPIPKVTEMGGPGKTEQFQSDIGKLQHDKDVLMKSGFNENHPVIKAIDNEMIKKSSTGMTEYQQESLELRKQSSEENRLLREQMHKDNIAIRQAFLDLAKNTKNRLPPSAQKDINTKTSELDRYINLISSYKDEYGGSIIGGPTMTEIYSRTGKKKDRVNWWKDWLFLDNKVRHELFGATLTPNEQRAWDAVTISENTHPDIARNAMKTRLEIARDALNREIEGYSAAGWDVNIQKKETTPTGKGVIKGDGWKATPIP